MAIYGILNDTLKMEYLNPGIKRGLKFLKEAELENIFTGIEKGESELYSSFLMIPGYVSVLFPKDWHSPGRKNLSISKVKKVVVKVAIDRK